MAIDGVLLREHSLCERFTYDRDGLFVSTVQLIEVATSNDWNAQSPKETRRDNTKLRAWVLFSTSANVTIGTELQSRTGTGIAPRGVQSEGSLFNTGKCINATYDFLVKINNLLACLAVKNCGNIDGKDTPRVHTSLCSLQRDERTEQHAGAGQQHE